MPRIKIHVTANEKVLISSRLSENGCFELDFKGPSALFEMTSHWLSCYSKKESFLLPPLDFSTLTPFQLSVLEALVATPFGKTLSYDALALLARRPGSARATGSCCKKNPFPLFVPCHRVIRKNGAIGNFYFGEKLKKSLIAFESPTNDL